MGISRAAWVAGEMTGGGRVQVPLLPQYTVLPPIDHPESNAPLPLYSPLEEAEEQNVDSTSNISSDKWNGETPIEKPEDELFQEDSSLRPVEQPSIFDMFKTMQPPRTNHWKRKGGCGRRSVLSVRRLSPSCPNLAAHRVLSSTL